jgi:hypothetical protein
MFDVVAILKDNEELRKKVNEQNRELAALQLEISEWRVKTQWIEDEFPNGELGDYHRADAIKGVVDSLRLPQKKSRP